MTATTVIRDGVDHRFDLALYTLAEAARALDVPASTFATWAKGYLRRPPGGQPVAGEPVVTSLEAPPGKPSVPFVGLAEGVVLAAVRRSGVPLQRIRPALEVLAREIGVAHALASKALYTDGAEVLFDYAQHAPHDEAEAAGGLVVVRSGQRVFKPVIDDYLRRIEYGPDGYAQLIRLPAYERANVLADPTRSFGQPIFARGGGRVSDVLDRFWAGDDIHTLTQEFGVPAEEIEDVLRAASRWAA
ncbi:MAG: hypothetical protein QOK39_2640 [Acidimicrobiaceae bacterium]|nr:hypothetical protein [Acidimicrobiaceae bacterium]